MSDLDPKIQKEAIKEALQEWLDSQFSKFGKWTLNGLLSVGLVGLVYLWAAGHAHGCHRAVDLDARDDVSKDDRSRAIGEQDSRRGILVDAADQVLVVARGCGSAERGIDGAESLDEIAVRCERAGGKDSAGRDKTSGPEDGVLREVHEV